MWGTPQTHASKTFRWCQRGADHHIVCERGPTSPLIWEFAYEMELKEIVIQ